MGRKKPQDATTPATSETPEVAPAPAPQAPDLVSRLVVILLDALTWKNPTGGCQVQLNSAEALMVSWAELAEPQRETVRKYLSDVANHDVPGTKTDQVRAAALALRCART